MLTWTRISCTYYSRIFSDRRYTDIAKKIVSTASDMEWVMD